MYRKLLFTVGLLIAVVFTFSLTFSFATDNNNAMNMVNDAANNVRGAVGGAENAVEGAVKDVTDTSRNAVNNVENGVNKSVDNMNTMGITNNAGYTANRTATTTTADANTGFLGMSSTMWTWLILAVAAVAIVALVWYYSSQVTKNRSYDDNE